MKLSGCTGQPGTFTMGRPAARSGEYVEIIGQAHRAGGIPLHGMDAAIGSAGPGGNDRKRFWRQPIDPRGEGDRLVSIGVVPHCRPISFALDPLVGNRSFDDEHERSIQLSMGGIEPDLHVFIAPLAGFEHAIVEDEPWEGREWQKHVFDAGLGGRGDGDGVAVAA